MTRSSPGRRGTLIAATTMSAVIIAGWLITASAALRAAETSLDVTLMAHAPRAAIAAATLVQTALDPVGAAVVNALVAAVVLIARGRRTASRYLAVSVTCWWSAELVKLLVQRPRPLLSGTATGPTTWSYPSGHTAIAAGIVLGLAAVFHLRSDRRVRVGPRVAWGVLGCCFVLAVGLSRLVLGVHYASDVIASMVWCAAVAVIVTRAAESVLRAR
jgi:undecaprenyl-diphosphatase